MEFASLTADPLVFTISKITSPERARVIVDPFLRQPWLKSDGEPDGALALPISPLVRNATVPIIGVAMSTARSYYYAHSNDSKTTHRERSIA